MIRLAIDTTTDRLTVAGDRTGESRRSAERAVTGQRQHARLLFPMMEEVLGELGGRLDDVSVLAIADGPGSFTGLRVGAAAAKALARARPGLAIWSASTLMVRAAGAPPPHGARVLVVTSALRGELFAAMYRMDLPRSIEVLREPGLATPESLHTEMPDLLVAEAPEKTVDRLAAQFEVPLVRGAASFPAATALLLLLDVPGGAQQITDVDSWEPFYGRPAEAQARWEALHGRALSHPSGDSR